MANYKYLKENGLYEAHKAFMRMCEGYGYSPLEEEGEQEEPQQAPDMMGGAPQGGAQQAPDMPGADAMGASGQGGMGMDPNMQAPDMAGGAPADQNGGAPEMPPAEGPMGAPEVPEEPMEEEEPVEEIDIDQVTDAQQKTFDRVNSVGKDLGKVDTRIEKLLGAIESMKSMIDNNNSEIESLKKEFEKRNPTQTEKLNMRSLDSYPFNIKPTDYWSQKAKDSNYSAYADNDEPTQQEYVITNNDVDDMTERDIAQSFAKENDLLQDINKIFGLR